MMACAIGGVNPLFGLVLVTQPVRSRADRPWRVIGPEFAIVRQQRPDDPGVLVRQRYGRHVLVPSAQQPFKPAIGQIDPAFRHPDDRPRAVDQPRPHKEDRSAGRSPAAAACPRWNAA